MKTKINPGILNTKTPPVAQEVLMHRRLDDCVARSIAVELH